MFTLPLSLAWAEFWAPREVNPGKGTAGWEIPSGSASFGLPGPGNSRDPRGANLRWMTNLQPLLQRREGRCGGRCPHLPGSGLSPCVVHPVIEAWAGWLLWYQGWPAAAMIDHFVRGGQGGKRPWLPTLGAPRVSPVTGSSRLAPDGGGVHILASSFSR